MPGLQAGQWKKVKRVWPGANAATHDRQSAMDRAAKAFRVIGSPGFPYAEARVRELAGQAFDRGFAPEGVARQLIAILASGSRRERLRGLSVPTLVVHGLEDPLVPVECGRDTAASIPGAALLEIPGMGHDLPRELWQTLADAIHDHVSKA